MELVAGKFNEALALDGPDGVADLQQRPAASRGVLHARQDRARGPRHGEHRRQHAALHGDHRRVADGELRRRRTAGRIRGFRARPSASCSSATTPPNRARCSGCASSRRRRREQAEGNRHRSAAHVYRRHRRRPPSAARPGTNVALLNGLCHLLIENGWIDRDFIAEHTVYFDDFSETVTPYTPDVSSRSPACPQSSCARRPSGSARRDARSRTCLQGVYQSNQATLAAARSTACIC